MPRSLIAVAAAAAAVAVFWAATLTIYPPPTCDETTYSSAGVSVLKQGNVGLTIFPAGTVSGVDTNVVRFGRSYAYGLAGFFSLFGTTLASARLWSLAGWVVAAALTGFLGAAAYDWRVGVSAAFYFATGTKAFFSAHLARPEMWACATVVLATLLAVCVVQQTSAPNWLALAAGLTAVWPVDFHLLGLAFLAGLAVATAIELSRQRRWQAVSCFAAGVILGGGLWLWTRGLGGNWSYLSQLQAPALAPLGGGGWRWLANLFSLPAWLGTVFWVNGGPLSLFEAALAVMGLLFIWQRSTPVNRLLAIAGLVALALFAVGTNFRWLQYALLWEPLWVVPGLAGLLELGRRLDERIVLRGWKWVVPALVVCLVGANMTAAGWLVFRYRGSNFDSMGSQLRTMIRPGSRVLADPVWWWALGGDRVFMSDDYAASLHSLDKPAVAGFFGLTPGATLAAGLRGLRARLKPDFVVVDSVLGCQTDTDMLSSTYSDYFAANCSLIGQVRGAWIGDPSRFALQVGQTAKVYSCP